METPPKKNGHAKMAEEGPGTYMYLKRSAAKCCACCIPERIEIIGPMNFGE